MSFRKVKSVSTMDQENCPPPYTYKRCASTPYLFAKVIKVTVRVKHRPTSAPRWYLWIITVSNQNQNFSET